VALRLASVGEHGRLRVSAVKGPSTTLDFVTFCEGQKRVIVYTAEGSLATVAVVVLLSIINVWVKIIERKV